ncbi:MAG: hypothetical protein ACFFA1_04125 [Promethearchaeota archaeon]
MKLRFVTIDTAGKPINIGGWAFLEGSCYGSRPMYEDVGIPNATVLE